MLAGVAKHNVDAKNRLFIPAMHRDTLGASFMAVPSFREKCIKLFSMEQWETYEKQFETLPGKLKERTYRFLYSNAAELTPDAQGRVLLPAGLVEYAQITKNVAIVGCGRFAEIWADEQYQALLEEEDTESMIAELEKMGF